jgi:hypothetical protein
MIQVTPRPRTVRPMTEMDRQEGKREIECFVFSTESTVCAMLRARSMYGRHGSDKQRVETPFVSRCNAGHRNEEERKP